MTNLSLFFLVYVFLCRGRLIARVGKVAPVV